MKVNLGCGKDIREGYLNYDCRDLPGVDIVDDIFQLEKHAPEIEELLVLDVIEHFSMGDQDRLFELFKKCLVPGGKLILKTPDLQIISVCMVHGMIHPMEVVKRIFGGQDYPENFHKVLYTIPMLGEKCTAFGFKVDSVSRLDVVNIEMVVTKL